MPAPRETIHVVAGVLRDARGRVLLTERPPGKSLAGMWEFPGGKVERGESARDALARELDEELGVAVQSARPLIQVPNGRIVLDVWEVDAWTGTPTSREGQALAWIDADGIDPSTMPPADRPVVTALRLPDRYLVTPEPTGAADDVLVSRVERALERGVRLVQLRAKALPRAALATLARRLRETCHAHDARLLLNGDWALAEVLGLDGVHLPAAVAATLAQRPLPSHRLVVVSCHDEAELVDAERIGADAVTLSPVRDTPSHPGTHPLGWARAAMLVARTPLPVYLLGGLGADDLAQARESGAQGIAAVRAFLD